jgi:hypothetical protein
MNKTTKKATTMTKKATKTSASNPMIGKPVIVRATVAGVHCGILSSIDTATSTVTLTNAHRLWRIYTRDTTGSVSDVAANGLKLPLSQHSIGAKLASVIIINPTGLEIAEATAAAYASIAEAAVK